jgi:sugar/nucleoside kinase (ribokinase family)
LRKQRGNLIGMAAQLLPLYTSRTGPRKWEFPTNRGKSLTSVIGFTWHYNRDVGKTRFDLAFVGTLSVDTIVTASDRVHVGLLGGGAAYAAAGARVWSESVGVVARVNSAFPEDLIQDLQVHGINTDFIRRGPETPQVETFSTYEEVSTRVTPNPASTFLRLGRPMPKSLIGYRPPAEGDPVSDNPPWAPRPEDLPQMEALSGAHLASSPYASQCTCGERLQTLRVDKLCLDPDTALMRLRRPGLLRDLVTGIGVFIPSERQARALMGSMERDIWRLAYELLELGSRHVVIKRGALGQCLLDGQLDERWLIPAYPCRVEDVTGAGHAYCGGFLAGWVATGNLVEAALTGAISASLAVEGSGPVHMLQTMPGLAEARRDSLRQMAHRM